MHDATCRTQVCPGTSRKKGTTRGELPVRLNQRRHVVHVACCISQVFVACRGSGIHDRREIAGEVDHVVAQPAEDRDERKAGHKPSDEPYVGASLEEEQGDDLEHHL